MLAYVRESLGERKLRLFACACVRRVWQCLDEVALKNVALTERYVDRTATAQERAEFSVACYHPIWVEPTGELRIHNDAWSATGWCWRIALSRAVRLADPHSARPDRWPPLRSSEQARQAALLRRLVGNPFRNARLDPGWRTKEAAELAWDIYEDRVLPERVLDPARLGILADALEDAGCTDESVLAHLRAVGPHARGCWALDLVLGLR